MTILINFVAVAVLLVSGLLAIIRGFLREILSIAAWLIAATCAYIAYINFSDSGTLSLVLVVVGAFLVSLLP
jgi:membrane protein required for colicin V production